jgi:transcriptional regulator with GAF, ATPase, and Fis domain
MLNRACIPAIGDLFAALAAGQPAKDWAERLVRAISHEYPAAMPCVFEDRQGLGSLIIAGKKPRKGPYKQTFSFVTTGNDRQGAYTAVLRLIVLTSLSDTLTSVLNQMRADAIRLSEAATSTPQPHPPAEDHPVTENDATFRMEFGIFVAGPATTSVIDDIHLYAPTERPVLIVGETGSGKEKIASAIHSASKRKAGPYVSINCACFTKDLLASELFGYVKGAFTGAVSDKKGLFEEASGGTIFLDEIGEMDPQHQPTLLRVLQEKVIRPVGASYEKKVDVRIVAATNKNLMQLTSNGSFRPDLYYRLAGVVINVKPLRLRQDEIPPLIDYLLHTLNERDGRHLTIDPCALEALVTMPWPGNVRELINKLEEGALRARDDLITCQALRIDDPTPPASLKPRWPQQALPVFQAYGPVMASGKSTRPESVDFLAYAIRSLNAGAAYDRVVDAIDRDLVVYMINKSGGNLRHTTRQFGITLSTLRRRIARYGLGYDEDEVSPPAARTTAA